MNGSPVASASAPHGRALGFWRTGRTSAAELYFALCLATIPVAFVSYYGIWKYKILMFGWALCLLLFGVFWVTGAARMRLSLRAVWPVFGFYAYLWLTAWWSYDPRVTLAYSAYDLLYMAIFFLSLTWAYNVDRWRLSYYFELVVLLQIGLAVFFLLTTGSLVDTRFGAVRSGMAFTFATALPFLFWRLQTRPSLFRAVLSSAVVVIIPLLGSRTALMVLPVVLAIGGYALLKAVRRPVYTSLLLAATGLVVLAAASAMPAMRRATLESAYRLSAQEQSLDIGSAVADLDLPMEQQIDLDRRLQAFIALETFLERPLLGGGYMNTLAQARTRFDRDVSAHGLVFTLLGETGLIGALLFLVLLGRFFRAMYAGRHAERLPDRGFYLAGLSTMIVMLLFGLFHQLHQSPSFYVLLGWGYALAPGPRPAGTTRAAVRAAD